MTPRKDGELLKPIPNDTINRWYNQPDTGTSFTNRNKDKIMNLLCVLPFRSANGGPMPQGYPFPSVGDKCVSIGQWTKDNKLYYQLEGYPEECGYNANCFAILPDTSEEVGIEHEHEAIIYQR